MEGLNIEEGQKNIVVVPFYEKWQATLNVYFDILNV